MKRENLPTDNSIYSMCDCEKHAMVSVPDWDIIMTLELPYFSSSFLLCFYRFMCRGRHTRLFTNSSPCGLVSKSIFYGNSLSQSFHYHSDHWSLTLFLQLLQMSVHVWYWLHNVGLKIFIFSVSFYLYDISYVVIEELVVVSVAVPYYI